MTDRNRDEKRNPREKNHPAQKGGQKSTQNRADRREQGGSQANLPKEESPSRSSGTEAERNQGGQQRDEQGQSLPEGRSDRATRSDRSDRSVPSDPSDTSDPSNRSDRSGASGGSQGDDRSGRARQGADRESAGRTPVDDDVDSPKRQGQPMNADDARNRKSGR